MKVLPFKATYPKTELISSTDSFFASVKMEYPNYYRNGFFDKSDEDALYVYRITSSRNTHCGIIGCSHINDFIENRILKHEHTLAAKEQKMINIYLQNEGMVKPILMTYRKRKKLDRILLDITKKPSFLTIYLEDSDETHALWKISNVETLSRIKKQLKKVENFYIADGHHRTSTALRLLQSQDYKGCREKLLGVYFSSDNLSVYDYNRIVDFNGLISPSFLMASLSKYCKIQILKAPKKPERKHSMTLFLDGAPYMLTWKKKYTKSGKRIIFDTQLVNSIIFDEILGIKDIRDNPRITYVAGIDGINPLVEATQAHKLSMGIALYPISLDNLMNEASNNRTLPPKSTWFEPRIKNGLLVKMF